jgi:endonuclease-3 related protein
VHWAISKTGDFVLLTQFADNSEIEEVIQCTGFYRVKAQRLKSLARHVIETYGRIDGMVDVPTEQLRKGLLNVSGIGEETADSYSLSQTNLIIDACWERIVQCIGVWSPSEG